MRDKLNLHTGGVVKRKVSPRHFPIVVPELILSNAEDEIVHTLWMIFNQLGIKLIEIIHIFEVSLGKAFLFRQFRPQVMTQGFVESGAVCVGLAAGIAGLSEKKRE